MKDLRDMKELTIHDLENQVYVQCTVLAGGADAFEEDREGRGTPAPPCDLRARRQSLNNLSALQLRPLRQRRMV
jgi:hypothetical protein